MDNNDLPPGRENALHNANLNPYHGENSGITKPLDSEKTVPANNYKPYSNDKGNHFTHFARGQPHSLRRERTICD